MCVELAGKLSEDLRQPGSWGAAVHTLTFQSGTENFAILGSLFWDKGNNSELGKTLPYKADPEAVNTHSRPNKVATMQVWREEVTS